MKQRMLLGSLLGGGDLGLGQLRTRGLLGGCGSGGVLHVLDILLGLGASGGLGGLDRKSVV